MKAVLVKRESIMLAWNDWVSHFSLTQLAQSLGANSTGAVPRGANDFRHLAGARRKKFFKLLILHRARTRIACSMTMRVHLRYGFALIRLTSIS